MLPYLTRGQSTWRASTQVAHSRRGLSNHARDVSDCAITLVSFTTDAVANGRYRRDTVIATFVYFNQAHLKGPQVWH